MTFMFTILDTKFTKILSFTQLTKLAASQTEIVIKIKVI